jgi:dihydropteroate synthase
VSAPALRRPQVMGILNVTPDSFSDGGSYLDSSRAVEHGLAMAADGADVIDIGGESTRPGAESVDSDTELARVLPVIEALHAKAPGLRLSIDTSKEAVAAAAVAAGASLINDVSASLCEVAAQTGASWIAMHRRGNPKNMQDDPIYEDVVGEVEAALVGYRDAASAVGVTDVWLDPGIGFGKSTEHNLALLAATKRLCRLGAPIVVGVSRKRLTAELTARSDGVSMSTIGMDDRREASLAAATFAMLSGASMVRCHEVRPMVHAAGVVAGV